MDDNNTVPPNIEPETPILQSVAPSTPESSTQITPNNDSSLSTSIEHTITNPNEPTAFSPISPIPETIPPSQSPKRNNLIYLVLILIFIVILIGLSLVLLKNTNKMTTKVTVSKVLKTKNVASSSSTSTSLKTFSWTYEGLTIKYPSSWTFENPLKSANPDYANSPTVFIKSNNQQTVNGYVESFDGGKTEAYDGAFDIELSVNSLTDNTCNVADNTNADASTSDHIVRILPLNVPNYKAMNIIEDGGYDMTSASEMVITDSSVKLGITTPPYQQDIYQSKKHPGQYVCISSGFFGESKLSPGNFNYVTIPLSTFESMPDYSNGLNALKSISY